MTHTVDLAKLVLRLNLGLLMLLHGIAKLMAGPGGIPAMVARTGLPSELGYLVYVGEVLAPLLVILGLWTRPAALVMAINIVVAVLLVHMGQFGQLTRSGGWALELQAFYFFTALGVMLLGAGRFSLGGSGGRLN